MPTLPDCIETQIAEGSCYVRFGAVPRQPDLSSRHIGQTVRGESVIADVDADGRIVGLELDGGPAKPCQVASQTPANDVT